MNFVAEISLTFFITTFFSVWFINKKTLSPKESDQFWEDFAKKHPDWFKWNKKGVPLSAAVPNCILLIKKKGTK